MSKLDTEAIEMRKNYSSCVQKAFTSFRRSVIHDVT